MWPYPIHGWLFPVVLCWRQAYNKLGGEFDVGDEGVVVEMSRYLGMAVGRCLQQERDTELLEQRAAEASAETHKIMVSPKESAAKW